MYEDSKFIASEVKDTDLAGGASWDTSDAWAMDAAGAGDDRSGPIGRGDAKRGYVPDDDPVHEILVDLLPAAVEARPGAREEAPVRRSAGSARGVPPSRLKMAAGGGGPGAPIPAGRDTPAKARLTFDRKQFKGVADDHFASVLAGIQQFDVSEIKVLCDPEAIPEKKLDKPKYSLLARVTRPLQARLERSLRQALKSCPDLRFEFMIALDNSGSMLLAGKSQEMLTLTVVLMEVFRRMEWPFGVVRFGEECKLLKSLDSGLTSCESDDKSVTRGQFILESITNDEKTMSADAVKFIAEHRLLFGRPKAAAAHRVILMITDGISNQSKPEPFQHYRNQASADLYMVAITPSASPGKEAIATKHREAARAFLEAAAPGTHCLLESGNVDELTGRVCQDICGLVKKRATEAARLAPPSREGAAPPLTQVGAYGAQNGATSPFTYPPVTWTGRAYVSRSEHGAPLTSVRDFAADAEAFSQFLPTLMDALEKGYFDLESSPLLVDILTASERHWEQVQQRLDGLITDVQQALEETFFPANEPTQDVADVKGHSLHIPNLVRYMITQGQEMRIYKNRIGSPKPEYRVTLILDQSLSMQGPSLWGATDAFLATISALDKLGITDFNVITVSSQVQLVKSYKQPWDKTAQHQVLSAIAPNTALSPVSPVGEAVFYATELMASQTGNKGLMYTFVFTDGFAGPLLRAACDYAYDSGVMPIGVGVGLESTGVCTGFSHWVLAQNLALYPDAIRTLAADSSDGETPNEKLFHQDEAKVDYKGRELKDAAAVHDLVSEEHFAEETKRMRSARDLVFTNDSRYSIDLCFVMDCTGSMQSWIDAARKYIRDITHGILARLKEDFGGDGVVRVGFVAYRDYGDAERFAVTPLTPDVDTVIRAVEAQRASGGADECEDVQGALMKALDLDWTGRTRFCVLVNDAPGHMVGGGADDSYPRGLPDVRPLEDIVRDLRSKKVHLMVSDFTANVKHMNNNVIRPAYEQLPKYKLVQLKLDASNTETFRELIVNEVSSVIASECM